MTYEQIETFLAIVTYGTITEAARHLYISQSTVSSRIANLEKELDVSLLIRQKGQRSIELTAYGKAFIPIASQWASLWKNTQKLKNRTNIQALQIASIDVLNNYTFVDFFNQHIKKYPHIRLSINTHHSHEIYQLVENRQADIGFVFAKMSYPDVLTKPLYQEEMYLMCRQDSPYHDQMPYGDLKSENEIYLDWGDDYKMWHDQYWSPDDDPLLSVNTGSMLQRYLNEPKRWAIAPMSVIHTAMKADTNLTFHPLQNPPAPRTCYEIIHRYPNSAHQKAVSILEDELAHFIQKTGNLKALQF